MYRNGEKLEEPYKNTPDPGYEGRAVFDWKLVHYEGSYGPWRGKYIPVWIDDNAFGRYANFGSDTAWEYAIGAIPERTTQSAAAYKNFDELTEEERHRMNELLDAPAAAIPAGFLLMMGDNRTNSYDGRGWGLVPRENVVGRSEFIWAPVGRWRRTH